MAETRRNFASTLWSVVGGAVGSMIHDTGSDLLKAKIKDVGESKPHKSLAQLLVKITDEATRATIRRRHEEVHGTWGEDAWENLLHDMIPTDTEEAVEFLCQWANMSDVEAAGVMAIAKDTRLRNAAMIFWQKAQDVFAADSELGRFFEGKTRELEERIRRREERSILNRIKKWWRMD